MDILLFKKLISPVIVFLALLVLDLIKSMLSCQK